MTRREIDRFFRVLSKSFPKSCRILLTGAGAGAVMGRIRATMDLDFAVRFERLERKKKEILWHKFDKAIKETTLRTGIAVQYAEDIDRWSSITYLDYDRRTKTYKRFGQIQVQILLPEYWAIGKLTRYLDPDVRDLVEILGHNQTPWRRTCRLWGKALGQSPKSTACGLFRRQVENFLTNYGRKIWGRRFPLDQALKEFHQSAGIRL